MPSKRPASDVPANVDGWSIKRSRTEEAKSKEVAAAVAKNGRLKKLAGDGELIKTEEPSIATIRTLLAPDNLGTLRLENLGLDLRNLIPVLRQPSVRKLVIANFNGYSPAASINNFNNVRAGMFRLQAIELVHTHIHAIVVAGLIAASGALRSFYYKHVDFDRMAVYKPDVIFSEADQTLNFPTIKAALDVHKTTLEYLHLSLTFDTNPRILPVGTDCSFASYKTLREMNVRLADITTPSSTPSNWFRSLPLCIERLTISNLHIGDGEDDDDDFDWAAAFRALAKAKPQRFPQLQYFNLAMDQLPLFLEGEELCKILNEFFDVGVRTECYAYDKWEENRAENTREQAWMEEYGEDDSD